MTVSYQLKRADFIFKNENDWEEVFNKSIKRTSQDLINELISSELKGRGGAGFPTGGFMMLFNSSRSMYNVLDNYLEFFREESFGQCTPCRVGCHQLLMGIKAVKRGEKNFRYLDKLLGLTETMKLTAKCGLGQSVANSFSSIVVNFREEMIY